MAEPANKQAGSTNAAIVFVGLMVLAIGYLGAGNFSSIANAPDPNGQLAQLGGVRIPDATQTTPETAAPAQTPDAPSTTCSGGADDPSVCSSKYVTRYVAMEHGMLKERFCQLSPNVVNTVCARATSAGQCTAIVDQLVAELTAARGDAGVEGVGSTCNDAYRGNLACFQLFSPPSNLQAGAPSGSQVAAAVLARASGRLKCCKADDALCKNQAVDAINAGEGASAVQLASCTGSDCPVMQQHAGPPPGGTGGGTNAGVTDAANAAYAADPIVQHQGAPPAASNPSTTNGGNVSNPSVPTAPAVQSHGGPNPVAPATNGGAQLTGAGVGEGSYSPYSFDQPRFQSLQTPHERALAQRARSDFENATEPSIVERFAQLIGADQRFRRQSPQGISYDTQAERAAPAFIVTSKDAHLRSIEQITRDVVEDRIPGGSRVDHYARALNVVGGPHTAGRNATSTNIAFANLQDLIVEDEAIRAMFVAEQTAKREKNKVFCIEEEKSTDCQERRDEVEKRVERQTFIEELEQRDLPDTAVEHFLAVYDGWVNPALPPPPSNPVLVSNALNNVEEGSALPGEAEQTNDGFVSWAWDGVKTGTAKVLDALRNWLTP